MSKWLVHFSDLKLKNAFAFNCEKALAYNVCVCVFVCVLMHHISICTIDNGASSIHVVYECKLFGSYCLFIAVVLYFLVS